MSHLAEMAGLDVPGDIVAKARPPEAFRDESERRIAAAMAEVVVSVAQDRESAVAPYDQLMRAVAAQYAGRNSSSRRRGRDARRVRLFRHFNASSLTERTSSEQIRFGPHRQHSQARAEHHIFKPSDLLSPTSTTRDKVIAQQ